MDEAKARQLVRNQFRLMDLSKVIMQRSSDPLDQAIINAARLINTLPPPGDVMREAEWKKLLPRVQALFDEAASGMGREVVDVLTSEVEQQVNFAAGYIKPNDAPLQLTPQAPAIAPPGFALGSSNATPPWAFERTIADIGAVGTATAAQPFTVKVPANIYGVVKDVRIAGQTLGRTFGTSVIDDGTAVAVGNAKTGLGKFLTSSIDRRVRQGFLMQQTTEEIAQELFVDAIRAGQLGPTALQLKKGATAVARTAVMDLASQVHQKVWDANSSVIKAYEFDASSDSRACPTCAVLDGKMGTKDEVPRPPIHPNCRCQRLPVTNTELELRKQGERRGTPSGVELMTPEEISKQYGVTKRKGESQRDFVKRLRAKSPKGVRWYATKRTVNGETYFQRARDLPAGQQGGVVGWLADPKTSESSLINAFGGGVAGQKRATWWRGQIKAGKDPQQTYKAMLDFQGMTNRSVSPDRMARFKPVDELPGASRKARSQRQPSRR